MKKNSRRISEVMVLITVYIGDLVFFRILNELGTDASLFETLPEGMVNLGIALAGTITGTGMAFIEFNVFPRIAHLSSRLYALSRFLITTTTVISGIALVHLLFTKVYILAKAGLKPFLIRAHFSVPVYSGRPLYT